MKYLISFLFLALAFSMKSEAKVTLPSILGDNMVLQQQAEVKLWGKARPNATVTVKTSWNGQTYKSSSDGKGGWSLTVSTPVAGGPYKIIFNDGELLTLQNVLIGEVWFCSGQSNMEMPMGGFDRQPVRGTNDIIAKAKPSTPIRMYTTDSKDGRWVRQFSKTPVEDCQGEWLENTPVNVSHISAVSYYFARYIQEVLEVPVGIVVSTWGGSKIEAWMSRESIKPFSSIDLSILDNDAEVKNPTATPCVLYNGKIAPLTNFAVRGFLWYQGESNRGIGEAYKYYDKFEKILNDFLQMRSEKVGKSINLRTEEGTIIQSTNEIYYFLIDKNKVCTAYTFKKNYIVKENLNAIYKKLDKVQFYSPHRCCIINLKYVDYISDFDIIMKNGEFIPMAQKRKKEFFEALHHYLHD